MLRRFSFQQQVLTGFVVTLLVVFFVAIVVYVRMDDYRKDSRWIDHAEAVLHQKEEVELNLLKAESSLRGYLITGNKNFRKEYKRHILSVDPALKRLSSLIFDNDGQTENIDSLQYFSFLKIEQMEDLVNNFDVGHRIEEKSMADSMELASFYMSKVKVYLQKISDIENEGLAKRKELGNRNIYFTLQFITVGFLIILLLFSLLFSFIKRTFKAQKLVEEKVRDANAKLNKVAEENERKNWLLTGAKRVDVMMRGEQEVSTLAQNIIAALCDVVDAQVGTFYLLHDGVLSLEATYAHYEQQNIRKSLNIGDGLVGQAALERKRILVTDIPQDYVKISSGIGELVPSTLLIQPIIYEDVVVGVIEMGFLHELSDLKAEFIEQEMDGIGISINTANASAKLKNLFDQTQQQSERLELQHEELSIINEKLRRKTQQLQASEEELTVQQEELRQTNAELEEKAEMLEERNRAVELANEAIEVKASELEQSSKYKSEFLANMSHELRTPLNSILILSKILKENKFNTLTPEQIKYAGVINTSGSDLLTLINDILDLSKIESGKMEIVFEDVDVAGLKSNMEQQFEEVARQKKILFKVAIEKNLPASIYTDKQRVEQILKNLLSNAFKFTPDQGTIEVSIGLSDRKIYSRENLSHCKDGVLAIKVRDTGIGISEENRNIVFQAFQQADGSTSRKYGGTGLGLSICRELSNLLGGEMQVESKLNIGSTFTLYLPLQEAANHPAVEKQAQPTTIPVSTKKKKSEKDPHTLLIVEDDVHFAEILKDYALQRGFEPLMAYQGDIGLQLAKEHNPDAIILDIMLPVMDGWAVLKNLKSDPLTADIPVHLMSARDETDVKARQAGAIGFLKKPVQEEQLHHAFDMLMENEGSDKIKRVLLIEDIKIQSDLLTSQLQEKDVEVKQAFNGTEALAILNRDSNFDCLILDIKLPDMSGIRLLEEIKADARLSHIPVVINTAMELDKEDMAAVMKHTNAMVLKSKKSNDRLLDEVNLFMNKIKTSSPVQNNASVEKALHNKIVLIVDDDMRNIFALSTALHQFDVKVEIASNGLEALRKLDEVPGINIVLMDIMMPEMDGYEAMREIRKQNRFNQLPVIALTAKAMKNDREKCLEAGANDYISKPVDLDKLFSLMRVWLS